MRRQVQEFENVTTPTLVALGQVKASTMDVLQQAHRFASEEEATADSHLIGGRMFVAKPMKIKELTAP